MSFLASGSPKFAGGPPHTMAAGFPTGTSWTTGARTDISARLAAEFGGLPADTVAGCVGEVWACAEHLGVGPTPDMIERIARERLMGRIKSRPPGTG